MHHVPRLEATVLWNLSPPRQRYAGAALDAARGASDELGAIAVLAGGLLLARDDRAAAARVVGGSSTPRRPPVHRRGAPRRGERHLLDPRARLPRPGDASAPAGRRQVRERLPSAVVYRDRDLERDLDVAVLGQARVRLGAGQVRDRPCRTAVKVAAFLSHHGVVATPRPCGPRCGLADEWAAWTQLRGSVSPDDTDPRSSSEPGPAYCSTSSSTQSRVLVTAFFQLR